MKITCLDLKDGLVQHSTVSTTLLKEKIFSLCPFFFVFQIFPTPFAHLRHILPCLKVYLHRNNFEKMACLDIYNFVLCVPQRQKKHRLAFLHVPFKLVNFEGKKHLKLKISFVYIFFSNYTHPITI